MTEFSIDELRVASSLALYYCLGRQRPAEMATDGRRFISAWIEHAWPVFDGATRRTMLAAIDESLKSGDFIGMAKDVAGWRELKEWMETPR